ncbi:protein PLASTID MOVEMENT IMPAIRED 2-like [Bidens hawaiensis]|uniref:protein PLASTID MOVEMENT IMPAIRED 2-like n=1 Tax=Bidens hawaiensis TaxID=980011 RepID=UPI00404A298B
MLADAVSICTRNSSAIPCICKRHIRTEPITKSKNKYAKSELESVRDLALKIEEANSRSRGLQRKPKWRQQEEPETSVKNEDVRYEQVMKELADMKQEMGKLKDDMKRVLKEKRHAERSLKASNSKRMTLLASMELMKKELQELDEEQTIVEFARIEAVKKCESIESDRIEEADRYKTQLSEAEAKSNELQITLFDLNLANQELSPINTIMEELESAKRELASVKGEGGKFMISMDVIRAELNHVRAEMARLRKAEEKEGLNVQSLNSKIMRAKAKLESLTSAESNANTIASNLTITLEKLQAEAETAKKDKDSINEEIENMKGEIRKIEFEIDLVEEKLDAAMEELEAIKSSESKSMENLRNVIDTTMEARDTASINGSMITITDFEYEYLTGKAGQAAVLADKKINAAQAWVEALKASEKELMIKIEMTQREISELSIDVGTETDADRVRPGSWEKVVPSPRRSASKVGNKVASPRRSVSKVGNKVLIKWAKLQKWRSPAARYSSSSKSGSVKREKVVPSLKKLFSKKNVAII